jgi:hypothetical protein
MFDKRMHEHHNAFLTDDHWNPKEYKALCNLPTNSGGEGHPAVDSRQP